MKSNRTLLAAASIVSVALALTACSSGDSAPAPTVAPTTAAAVATGPFGAACSAIPADVAAAAPTVPAADAAGKSFGRLMGTASSGRVTITEVQP